MLQLILFIGLLFIAVGLLVIAIVYLNRDSICDDSNTVFSVLVVLGAVMLAEKFIFTTLVNIYK